MWTLRFRVQAGPRAHPAASCSVGSGGFLPNRWLGSEPDHSYLTTSLSHCIYLLWYVLSTAWLINAGISPNRLLLDSYSVISNRLSYFKSVISAGNAYCFSHLKHIGLKSSAVHLYTKLLGTFLNLIFVVLSIMLFSSEISPTRCNNCVFILRNGFTLQVSGDNLTHHQEYICCIWPQVSRLT